VRRSCAIALCALAFVALATPFGAAAQQSKPTPSANELWESYPLHQTPEPGADGDRTEASAVETRREPPVAAADEGDGGPELVLLLAGAVIAIATALVLLRRRAGRRAGSPAAVESFPSLAPPDQGRGWLAEIEWLQSGDEARFRVVARNGEEPACVVAESPQLPWPPEGTSSIEAMTKMVDGLVASLAEAGWRPLAPGEAWYAKRFGWEPVPAPPAERAKPRAMRTTEAG
jgi:hypothetical protein